MEVEDIVSALALAQRRRCTTGHVENLHGASASIHRWHKELGRNVLQARALLRLMLPAVTQEVDKISVREDRQLEALDVRCPQRLSGLALFVKDYMGVYWTAAVDGPAAQAAGKDRFGEASSLWRELPRDLQIAYENRAILEQGNQMREMEEWGR